MRIDTPLFAAVFCTILAAGCKTGAFVTRGEHPAWSKDGRSLAFQRTSGSQTRIGIVSADGAERMIGPAEGNSSFPAWTAEGDVVFSYANLTNTAFAMERLKTGEGCNLFRTGGASVKRLTDGHVRDWTPAISPDDAWLYFATTRGVETKWPCNRSSIMRIPLAGGKIETVVAAKQDSCGFASPAVSNNGKLLAFSQIDSFWDNWGISVAKISAPAHSCRITPPEMPAYTPSWSPDGRHIACTAYRPGDDGWSIYILHAPSATAKKLCPGKNPAWSPDGASIAFDHDGKIQTRSLRPEDYPRPKPAENKLPLPQIAQLSLQNPGKTSRPLNEAFAYGRAPLYIDAEIVPQPSKEQFQYIAVASYANAPLGLQLYLRDGIPCFATRDASGNYIDIRAKEKLPPGKSVRITAYRGAGSLAIFIDGELAATAQRSDFLSLDKPLSLATGRDFSGTIASVELGRNWPLSLVAPPVTPEEIFAE